MKSASNQGLSILKIASAHSDNLVLGRIGVAEMVLKHRSNNPSSIVSDNGTKLPSMATPVCVPKAPSVLISRRDRLTSAHHDRADVVRPGRFGGAIQIEEPA